MPDGGSILLVEDSPDDVFFLQRALKSRNIATPLHSVGDGRQAIDYLSGAGPFADRARHPLPRLVLLDLQLPHYTGLEVLAWIRSQPTLKCLPVVIFSSSRQASDIGRAYDLGANSYLVKPTDVAELGRIAEALCRYWLQLNYGPVEENR